MTRFRLLVVAFLTATSVAAEVQVPREAVRKTVVKALPFIEHEGEAWMADRGCVSCHQTAFLIWTHHEAGRRGFPINRTKTGEWTTWALLKVISGEDGSTPQAADTLAQVLLSRDEWSNLTAKPRLWTRTVDPYENVLKFLFREQRPEGKWVAGGQSENPADIPTGWALLALHKRDQLMKTADENLNPAKSMNGGLVTLITANDEALVESREHGLQWLKTIDPAAAELNEQAVVGLLLENAYGATHKTAQRTAELQARQNADGGWSARLGEGRESDAFATGQSVYALCRTGIAPDHPSIGKALRYLIGTQQVDGSWRVPTSAIHEPSGKPDRDARTDTVYRYWGTAWATLGPLQTLPESPMEAASFAPR